MTCAVSVVSDDVQCLWASPGCVVEGDQEAVLTEGKLRIFVRDDHGVNAG
jgi:hypothetical protein